MNNQERFLNVLDGVLLAPAMAWTLTIATALFHPTGNTTLRAAMTEQARGL
jgi:hypothetical protein